MASSSGTGHDTAMDAAPARTDFLHGFDDCEWMYYIRGHDEAELLQVDELDALEWEKLWLKPIRASLSEFADEVEESVVRDPNTGQFAARIVWEECGENVPGAEPWMGVKYAPA